jgi:branched-chain amino acid transport system permease protein
MPEGFLEQVINGLMMGSIYVLVALGMVLIYGVLHVLNFAHGVLFTVGAYLCHLFVTRLTGSYALAVVLSMAVLSVLGMALEHAVFRPLRGNLRNQVIASLGLILVIENTVVWIWGPNALQMKIPATQSIVALGELHFNLHLLIVIAITLGVVAALFAFLKFTKLGTAIRATSQSAEAALVVGIPVERVHRFTFALSAALAALGGALLGPLFLVFPTMGNEPLVKGLAGIILGGMGSVPGAVIGALVIGVAEALSTLFFPTDYRNSVAFMVIVLVLLARPQGLFGVRVRGED